MDKNTIWAIVLSTLIIVVFMFLQPILYPQKVVEPSQTSSVETDSENSIAAKNEGVEAINSSIINELTKELTAGNFDAENSQNLIEETFVFSTNKANITFTNRGGDIIKYELIEHNDKEGLIQMADNVSEANRAFSIALGDGSEKIINSIFDVNKSDNVIEFTKSFNYEKADGSVVVSTIKKTYTFIPDEYLFKLDVTIENPISDIYTLRTSPQIGPHYNRKKDRYEYRRFLAYTNGKSKKKMLGDNGTEYFDAASKGFTWTGVAGKYFSILVKPENPQNYRQLVYSSAKEVNDYANAQVMLVRNPMKERVTKDSYYIYVGPQTEKSLARYNNEGDNEWGVSGFRINDSLSSSGILSWLEAILKWIMEQMHDKLHVNWGISIILMTILLKLAMFPLTKKSSISTLKMQQIQPQMQELQEKYKNNQEKLNLEMAKLYKEMGYNPMSGCLPMLLQFPLIIAMFNLFNNYFEFRGASFIPGWIPDLSVGDSVATLGFSIPLLGNEIRLLPIIYVVSQLFYSKITQAGQTNNGANANNMKFMMYGMPLIFFFIFYNAPAGLLIYWIVSNLLQLVQQFIINKTMAAKREEMGISTSQQKPQTSAKSSIEKEKKKKTKTNTKTKK